jgi:hypothetical protein
MPGRVAASGAAIQGRLRAALLRFDAWHPPGAPGPVCPTPADSVTLKFTLS